MQATSSQLQDKSEPRATCPMRHGAWNDHNVARNNTPRRCGQRANQKHNKGGPPSGKSLPACRRKTESTVFELGQVAQSTLGIKARRDRAGRAARPERDTRDVRNVARGATMSQCRTRHTSWRRGRWVSKARGERGRPGSKALPAENRKQVPSTWARGAGICGHCGAAR